MRNRIFCLAGLFLLLLSLATAEEAAPMYTAMPRYLQVVQRTHYQEIRKNVSVRRTYPDSQNSTVDAQINALVDEMAESCLPSLPSERQEQDIYLDVGPVITRTGTSWMSFLTLAEIYRTGDMISTAFDARVYDMQTGERITLCDVFAPDSEAWALLEEQVRLQLTAAFPQETPDEAALDALCTRQALENAAFTLSAARLTLTYHAEALYPGRNQLLHVHLYYPDIRPLMTERAFAQTDNSRFPMIALTFDDGGAGGLTRSVTTKLRQYGAAATFFIVGKTMRRSEDNLCRQYNAGYSLQTHTYTHDYPGALSPELIFEQKAQFDAEMADVVGVGPTFMRAPGGRERYYIEHEIGYPLINWSLSAGDAGGTNIDTMAGRIMYNAKDGDIALLHDIHPDCSKYTGKILEHLSCKGFLFVTLEELFADAGTVPQAHRVYRTATESTDSPLH